MNRSFLLSLLAYALILAGLASLNGALLVLAIPLVVFLGSGLLFGPGEIQVEAERSLGRERTGAGQPVEVRISLHNRGRGLELVQVRDRLPPGVEVVQGHPALLAELPSGGDLELRYTVQARRGYFSFAKLDILASDRLGIWQKEATLTAPGDLFVLPAISRLRSISIRPRRTLVYAGTIPAREGGAGVDFHGVRNYQVGDSLRQVNWKASARRTDSLFSNEFELERGANVGLVLDARLRSNLALGGESLFEYSVTAAAGLAQALLASGNRVGLLVYGAYLDWTYPGFGKIQRERIFQALVRASPGVSQVFDKLDKLPTRIFPTHSQIILISSLLGDDLPVLTGLRAKGYQVMVVSPDPLAFEAKSLPRDREGELGLQFARLERRVLVRQLQRQGVQVLNWDLDLAFDQAMQVALRRLPRRLRNLRI